MKAHRGLTARTAARAEQGLYRAILSLRTEAECLPYRKIHELTGVSVTTIGRVARFLTAGNGGYQVALKRLSPL